MPGMNYNSAVTVAPNGQIVAHYRKSFLYYTDATWAQEGSGFHVGALPLPWSAGRGTESGKQKQAETRVTMGICMDINPYNFTAPWAAYEFANHVLSNNSQLNILSMAWLSHELIPADIEGDGTKEPDMKTLSYWVERFGPLIKAEGEGTILVMANRCGVEGKACYAGTSTVMQVSRGEVNMWDICGKGEERCLVVDTEEVSRDCSGFGTDVLMN